MPTPNPTFDVIKLTTGADTAAGGTLSFAYPAGKTAADYLATGAVLAVRETSGLFTGPTVSLGATIDVTYPAGKATIPAGSTVTLQLNRVNSGEDITPLTAATGTASDTIADVTGAFSQSVLNNNFKSLATKLNKVLSLLDNLGITA